MLAASRLFSLQADFLHPLAWLFAQHPAVAQVDRLPIVFGVVKDQVQMQVVAIRPRPALDHMGLAALRRAVLIGPNLALGAVVETHESTTNTSPSHDPAALPKNLGSGSASCGRPSIGTVR